MYLLEKELRATLKSLGARWYEVRLPEVLMLCNLLQENETVIGVVFGKYKHFVEQASGRGMLVATNYRILLIDRKPLYLRYEELPYNMLNGFSLTSAAGSSSLTLETRVGDIMLKSWNHRSAVKFIQTIEKYIIRTSAQFIYPEPIRW